MKNLPYVFLYRLVFLATCLGCLTNCLPAAVPFLLALDVAAYSFFDKPLIAFSGKYLSPVAFEPCVEGLPDFVRHFCLVHARKDFCDFLRAIIFYHER